MPGGEYDELTDDDYMTDEEAFRANGVPLVIMLFLCFVYWFVNKIIIF